MSSTECPPRMPIVRADASRSRGAIACNAQFTTWQCSTSTAVYRFQYRSIESVREFRPFIGFPDFDRVYESSRLWPFFDLRVMDRKRPDYSQYVGWLGLHPRLTGWTSWRAAAASKKATQYRS